MKTPLVVIEVRPGKMVRLIKIAREFQLRYSNILTWNLKLKGWLETLLKESSNQPFSAREYRISSGPSWPTRSYHNLYTLQKYRVKRGKLCKKSKILLIEFNGVNFNSKLLNWVTWVNLLHFLQAFLQLWVKVQSISSKILLWLQSFPRDGSRICKKGGRDPKEGAGWLI